MEVSENLQQFAFLMHKQHPQTAYRKYAVLMGTIFENCDSETACYDTTDAA